MQTSSSALSVSIDGVAFRHTLSSEGLLDALKLIAHARTTVRGSVAQLRASIQNGDIAAELGFRQSLLVSPEALLTSAVAANKKLPAARRKSLDFCLAVPNAIDFAKPFSEKVPVRFKGKKGGWRAIHNHGLQHRTAQHAIVRVIGQYLKPKSIQFTQTGVHPAVSEAKKAIETGHHFVARLDIKEFFVSFSSKLLAHELPLPKEVVDHAVLGRRMKVVVDKGKTAGNQTSQFFPHAKDLLPLARLGIPTGSASSPIVGIYIVSRLGWSPMQGVIVVNYADDFLVLALSATLLDEAVEALVRAVGDLPGGHFDLKLKSTGNITHGVDFLGHNLSVGNGAVKIKPTNYNLNTFYGAMDRLDTKFGNLVFHPGKKNMKAALICAAEMHALVRGWIAAFRACDEITTRWAHEHLKIVEDALKTLGITTVQIEAAVEPWMRFKPCDYALGH